MAITAPIITGPKTNEIFFHMLSFCLVKLMALDPLLCGMGTGDPEGEGRSPKGPNNSVTAA